MVGPYFEIQFNFHFKPHFLAQEEVWAGTPHFPSVPQSSTPDWFLPQVNLTDIREGR